MVEELAGFGATVHTCSRKEGELSECLKKWEAEGLRVTGSVCDVSVSDQREDLMRKVSSLFNSKLNILVADLLFLSLSLSRSSFIVTVFLLSWISIIRPLYFFSLHSSFFFCARLLSVFNNEEIQDQECNIVDVGIAWTSSS